MNGTERIFTVRAVPPNWQCRDIRKTTMRTLGLKHHNMSKTIGACCFLAFFGNDTPHM